MTDRRPVFIIGGGGHAKVVVDTARVCGHEIVGIVDADPSMTGSTVGGIKIVGTDAAIQEYGPGDIFLANGVGNVLNGNKRRAVYETFREKKYTFITLVHPSAIVSKGVALGEGAQIMAGAVVQPDTHIGENAIVNSRASVDHDCDIGADAHVAPGAVLCGGVRVGPGTHVGAGATVVENVNIGAAVLVAAGAVVTSDVADNAKVAGVPARVITNG